MASNKDPFVRSRSSDGKASQFMGLVQAGSTQEIKTGEICCFNKTAGYWIPVSATSDYIYALAIAHEEQKSDDSARYISFYSLHPNDEFEFEINAARALAVGDRFTLTSLASQKLTYSATSFPVARCVDYGHYPSTGTTIRNRSYAVVTFSVECTYWGLIQSGEGLHKPKIFNSTSSATLYTEQSGLILINTGAAGTAIHVLPQSCPAGTTFTAQCATAYDTGFAPGAAGAIYIEGAKQTDDKNVTVDAIGDSLRVTSDGNGDWFGEAIITSAADATGAIDVEA